MEKHLNRMTALFAAYSFAALVLSVTPGLTHYLTESDNGARLVFYNGKQAVWGSKIKDSGTVALSLEGDGLLTLSKKEDDEDDEDSSSDLKLVDYRGKMVRLYDGNNQKTIIWLVGVDGKRRLIPNQETYKCLKGTGLEDPIWVSTKVPEELPIIENAWAICGTNMMRPNDALQQGSYLQAGDYKLLLTDRALVQTKKGNQVWSSKVGAAQLILESDGNLVEYDSEYKAVWASETHSATAGLLILRDDGSLRLYDGKQKQVWAP